MTDTPKIVLTTGEPAGIGPDIVLQAALCDWPVQLMALGDRELLLERMRQLQIHVELTPYSSSDRGKPHTGGQLPFIDIPLTTPCTPGFLNPDNASYVLAQIDLALSLCRAKECAAMVTAPLHKGIINASGTPFSGHTEFLAERTGADEVVMLLQSKNLRVALATTHIPLRDVPGAITASLLNSRISVLESALRTMYGIEAPRITVLGLNPHAGESGHLGSEEQTIISPVCERLQVAGLSISGPVPADTAFIPSWRERTDAYFAMYHDQGLTVIKSEAFYGAVNITLGLPIIRTSVDHGTALDLAGSGSASAESLTHAIQAAIDLIAPHSH